MALKQKQRTIETQKIRYQRRGKGCLPGSAVDLGSVCHIRKKGNKNGVLEWVPFIMKQAVFSYYLVYLGRIC